jgi:hypothetical protein
LTVDHHATSTPIAKDINMTGAMTPVIIATEPRCCLDRDIARAAAILIGISARNPVLQGGEG